MFGDQAELTTGSHNDYSTTGRTCTNGAAHNGVSSKMTNMAPEHCFPAVCFDLRRRLLAFLKESVEDEMLRTLQDQIRLSMGVIEEALKRYSLDQLSISYNGGKDCLVLLILLLACLPTCSPTTLPSNDTPNNSAPTSHGVNDTTSRLPPSSASLPPPPLTPPPTTSSHVRLFQAIYIVPPDPFPEVDDFVATTTKDYHLALARYQLPMRAALDAYLDEHRSIKAIFMGTRRTDPNGEFLTHFTPTDAGFPQFMRVHPVIDWHYAEIWAFIRHFDIPFCNLYNRGFTSLGGTTDTRPNPVLAVNGNKTAFRPAFELMTDNEERLGRGR